MASFRTHISFGAAIGILSAVGPLALIAKDAPSFMVAIFLAGALGSILPDIDSDSGIPFHITFGSLAVIAAALVLAAVYKNSPHDYVAMVVWVLGSLFFVWGFIGFLFKKFTRHRGMAHSLPSMLLVGLITFFAAGRLYFSDPHAFILGVVIMAGFLSHLILDEVYAALNFQGTVFIPNKAFGSALKLKSHSGLVNLCVFVTIIFLLAGNTQRLIGLASEFWSKIMA